MPNPTPCPAPGNSHTDTQRGHKGLFTSSSRRPARPARLQAPAGQLLPAAAPRAAGLQTGIVGRSEPGGSSGSVPRLWWEQSLQQREQVRRDILGSRRGEGEQQTEVQAGLGSWQ